ncbi:hypothetical protein JOM56_014133, partial [Amanita muscaria]
MNNTGIKKRKLTDFFSIESREEKEDRMARSWDNLRVEHDKRARQAALEESKRVEQVREGNRLRKQKQRAKEKEQKMADSEANPKNWVGASIVAAEQLEIKHFSQKLLRAFDDVDNKSESLAEMSQPGRQFREAMKKKRKPQGRKSTHSSDGTLNAIRTHWKNPLIWPHIEAAVARVGWPWSPREICKKAVNINPQMFQGLTEQVVGRWIDRESCEKGIFKWKDNVLKDVSSGHTPGGQSTQVGILQPYPDLVKSISNRLEALRQA